MQLFADFCERILLFVNAFDQIALLVARGIEFFTGVGVLFAFCLGSHGTHFVVQLLQLVLQLGQPSLGGEFLLLQRGLLLLVSLFLAFAGVPGLFVSLRGLFFLVSRGRFGVVWIK